MKVDFAAEKNMDKLAGIALSLSERIREEDVHEMRDHLINFCFWHPVKAAQLMMTFAAWLDQDESTETLGDRAEAAGLCRSAVLDKRIQRLNLRRAG